MRRTVMAFAFLFSLSLASPVSADNRQTANEFLSDCKVAIRLIEGEKLYAMQDVESAVRCLSYLHGLRDALHMQYVGHGDVILCPAEGVTASQLVRVFVQYAEAHPARLHEDARNIAIEALFKAFPCGPATRA